jgi:choline dehydrogenase-like flavoprotein
MPFIDLNKQETLSARQYDYVIIGAGASGIMLAVKLSASGKQVLLVESGHFSIDEERQQLNEVTHSSKKLENAVWGRKRAVGGTTLAWGGQSLPFSKIDFSERDWVNNSGWPISFDDLAAHYKMANEFMQIDTLDYRDDILPGIKLLHSPDFDTSVINYHVSKWANEPNFVNLYRKHLEQQVDVVYNAVLTQVIKEGTAIVAIQIANFNKQQFTVAVPGHLILSVGGIETSRILLLNKLGNPEWVGKCFMDHPCIEVGIVQTSNEYALQRQFNTHIWQGRKYSIRMSLSEQIQREKKLLNCSGTIMFTASTDQFDPYAELKAFKKDFKIGRLFKVSGKSIEILKSVIAYIRHRFYYKINTEAKLLLMMEQEPDTGSYISLSDQVDIFNKQKANINWVITKKTWETAVLTARYIKSEIERLNLGKVALYKQIDPDTSSWNNYLSDVNHHMGGARMSGSEKDGVVDNNLKVWGTDNLYICSCAVFPTSSHSNPTLTMLALANRLHQHLLTKSTKN